MTKKRLFLGMLVFGLTLIACENDTTNVTNKTALVTAISNAESALAATVVNEATIPADVVEWVTAYISTSDKIAYQTAVVAAQTVNDNTAATQAQVDNAVSTLSTAIAGKIKAGTKLGASGDTGPAGGTIFYVQTGTTYGNWKYLEAAPADLSGTYAWGVFNLNVPNTATDVGTGNENTRLIVEKHPQESYAANLCDVYEHNGFADWFLPSKDELNLMYTNLKLQSLGDFGNTFYWSSSQTNAQGSCGQTFSGGYQSSVNKSITGSVRAVRAF
jgi:hypothetical protein